MTVTVRALGQKDAHDLAPLIAANAQAVKRGAPRRPDEYYAELLVSDRTAQVVGAFDGDRLVGFAVFFDLPDPVSGLRVGMIEALYTAPEVFGEGVDRRLVETLVTEGQSRGWARLRWMLPKPVDPSATGLPEASLADEIARPSTARLYEIVIDPLA
ncbi:GNAT family N-acetyltransferase [Chthonobacter rhizosphaerae]|uniref:GNAT family N-acetyltransferase n=1 Tax=Chthonobacter rhizosphaerae TaxID=2735553 RepID=UPI0015EEDC5D|nr:GNAT family N-acetyltransferase [Chthonobacter rhizosphaerae]